MTSLQCSRCGFLNLPDDPTCFKCGWRFGSTTSQPYFPPPTHGMMTIWRKRSVLIMTKGAVLPNRCIKCNAPADDTLKRKLTWHHPALYLVIFAGFLLYLILAMVLRQTATVNIGLCEEHAAARRQNIAIAWIMALVALGSFGVAAWIEDATFAAIGCVLLLAAAIYGIAKCRVVVPAKIDNHTVWLNGINANYLQEFPEWRGSH